MIIQTPPNLSSQPNVEFDKNSFNANIWNKGYDILLEKARICPCAVNGRGLSNCQNCRGYGYFWINPIKQKALISSINAEGKIKEWSEENTGRYQVSLIKYSDDKDNADRITYMDRITFLDQYSEFCESIQLSKDEDTGKYFGFTAYEIEGIVDAFVFKSSSEALVKLTKGSEIVIGSNDYTILIDKDFSEYEDFNGVVTLYYKHRKQIHVIDIPHDIRASKVKDSNGNLKTIQLPIQAIAQQAHISFDRPDYSGGEPINNSYLGVKSFVMSSDGTVNEVDFNEGELGYTKDGDSLDGFRMTSNEEGEVIISDTNGKVSEYEINDEGFLIEKV